MEKPDPATPSGRETEMRCKIQAPSRKSCSVWEVCSVIPRAQISFLVNLHHRCRSLQSSPGNQTPPDPSFIYVKGPWNWWNVFHMSPLFPYWTSLMKGHRSERHAQDALYKTVHIGHAWSVISHCLEKNNEHQGREISHNGIEHQVT